MMADTKKCANSGRVEINSSVTDSLHSVHGVIYVIFCGRIRIPRISGNFGACADSAYQAVLSADERDPGFEAIATVTKLLWPSQYSHCLDCLCLRSTSNLAHFSNRHFQTLKLEIYNPSIYM